MVELDPNKFDEDFKNMYSFIQSAIENFLNIMPAKMDDDQRAIMHKLNLSKHILLEDLKKKKK